MQRRLTISLQTRFGTLPEQVLGDIEAVGNGVGGPLSTAAQLGLRKFGTEIGVNPNIMAPDPALEAARAQTNPISNTLFTMAGLMLPVGQGAVLAKAGEWAAAKIPAATNVVREGIMAGVARGAVKLATENALYQTGDEANKLMLGDPNQSIGSALLNVSLAGAIGAGLGGGLAGVSPLWKAAIGQRASQFVANFRGRLQEHLTDPDRTGTFTDELSQFYNNIKQSASALWSRRLSSRVQKLLMTQESKLPEELDLTQEPHFIFSAEDPLFPAKTPMTTQEALAHLKSMGEDAVPAMGQYGGTPQPSIIVRNPQHIEQLNQFAKDLGQEYGTVV